MNDKDIFKNWLQSNKYKELQAKLSNLKKERLNHQFILNHINQMKDQTIFLQQEQLEKLLDLKLAYAYLKADTLEADFMVEAKINQFTKAEVYHDFTKNLIIWYFYLKAYLTKENFELCIKLRDVIKYEIEEFKSNISLHYDFEQQADEDELVEYINSFIKEYLSI